MMRFEYDPKFIKLLAKEMVKEMQKVKSEAKEPELITVKEAAETLIFLKPRQISVLLQCDSEHRSLNTERKLNNLKKKIMKKMNKVIAAMMMMAITFAMPAMAGHKTTVSTSRQPNNHSENDKVAVVVNNDKKASHFDKVDKKTSHFDTHKTHAYRPDVKTCTIKVSRHDSHKKVVAKVENMKGVMDTNWNPRTRELTVRYDANKTSARNIKHFMA